MRTLRLIRPAATVYDMTRKGASEKWPVHQLERE